MSRKKRSEPLQSAPLSPQPPRLQTEDQDTEFSPDSIKQHATVDEYDDQNKVDKDDAWLNDLGTGLLTADSARSTPSTGRASGPASNIDDDEALPPVPSQFKSPTLPNIPAAQSTDTANRKTISRSLGPNPLELPPPRGSTPPTSPRRKTGKLGATGATKTPADATWTGNTTPPTSSRRRTGKLGATGATKTPADATWTGNTTPSTPSRRKTGKIAAAGTTGTTADATWTGNTTPSTPSRRKTGKIAAARTTGTTTDAPLASNAIATDKAPVPPTSTTSTGKEPVVPSSGGHTLVPAGKSAANSAGWPPRRTPTSKRNIRSVIIVALAIVILLILFGGGWAALAGGILNSPPATITITPASQIVQDTYLVQGVPGNANPDNRQITVRQLTSTRTATDTVNATGHAQIPAVSATGALTFSNGLSNDFNVAAGTTFQVGNVQIATDTLAIVPARTSGPPVQFGQKTVSAHAVQGGTAGNIAAFTINQGCCDSAQDIQVQNQNPFSGGQDAQNYTFLQTSDVNAVTNTHQDTLKSDAQNAIKTQIKSGEQILNDTNCGPPQTTEDAVPGAHGVNVPTAHVTVTVNCKAQVFDANTVQTIARNALTQKLNKNPALGAGYVPTGQILTQTRIQTQQNGNVVFQVTAKGVWYYQWTNAMKQDLLNKIKGLSKAQAQAILNSYTGVGNATIAISGGGTSLPNDVNQIAVDVKTVNGF